MKKHPHDEVIRAYLDGKTIQVKVERRDDVVEWMDITLSPEKGETPIFYICDEYRIKPEPKWKWVVYQSATEDYFITDYKYTYEGVREQFRTLHGSGFQVIGPIEETKEE